MREQEQCQFDKIIHHFYALVVFLADEGDTELVFWDAPMAPMILAHDGIYEGLGQPVDVSRGEAMWEAPE